MIRPVRNEDALQLAEIYNYYIEHTVATFEEVPLDAEDLRARMDLVAGRGLPWLVAERAGAVAGYCYAGPWRERSAYRYSVESTVYLAPACTGEGLGTQLYATLFARLRQLSVHVVMGGITLPNAASVALHEKMGMKQVAHFPEVGYKDGRWLDVGYWQLVLAADNAK